MANVIFSGEWKKSSNVTLNQSIAIPDNPDRYILVFSNLTTPSSTDPATTVAVTIGGQTVPMLLNNTTASFEDVVVWGLVNPPSGTVTFSVVNSQSWSPKIVVVVLDGIDQATSYRTPIQAAGSSSTPSPRSMASNAQIGDLIIDGLGIYGVVDVTQGAGQTLIQKAINGSQDIMASSYKTATAVNESTSWSWASGSNRQDSYVSISMIPSGGDPAPAGIVTLGTPTDITSSSATIPYFYSENDETGFEYRLDGGSALTVTSSPLLLTDLDAGTFYSVEVRAVNGSTPGDWSAPATFTTATVTTPIAFSGTIPAQTFTNGQVVSVNLATYFTGTLTPFTFARTGAALTGTGLSISSAGVLNGTATTGSVTGVTVTGTDTVSNTAVSNAFNVTVNAAVAPVSFSGTIPAISGTQNTAITPVNTSTYFTGSLTPFTYSLFSGTLPTGVTLNISTGVISGTPTVSFSGNIVVRATDSGGNTANSNSISVTVSAAVGTITITGVANNTNTPWISSAVDAATIMPLSLGSVVVNKAGLSTTAGATLVIADAAITTGTEYIIILKIGTAYGWYRAVAT